MLNRSKADAVNTMISIGGDVVLGSAGLHLHVVGEEHVWSHRPAVFLFNHQSSIDPVLLMALLRRDVTAVAKKELAANPIVLGPFKKGALRLAMAGGVPVVPVVFRNSNDVWPLGTQFMRPGTVDVVVHPPIPTGQWSDATQDAHVADVRQLYLDTLADWPAR